MTNVYENNQLLKLILYNIPVYKYLKFIFKYINLYVYIDQK